MATKDTNSVKSEQFQDDKQGKSRAVLARLYWLLLGHIVLIWVAISIYKSNKAFGWLDIFYLFVVVSMVCIRYYDIKNWGGQTSTGEPATISDWRRYSLFLVIIALIVLAAVHLPLWVHIKS